MRKLMWAAVPIAAAMVSSAPAYADDEQPCSGPTVAALAQWAGITGKLASWREDNGLIAATACKAMPDAPGTTIAIVAFDTHHVGKNSDDGKLDQVVALVEGDKVVAAHRSVIEEDAATQVGYFHVDTARYQLAPDVRAFGTVFDSAARGPSCPYAVTENELTLWVREGSDLRPVFGTNLDGWISIDEDSCGSGMEGSRSESAHMTVAIEKTASHGFADLALTAHIARSRMTDAKDADLGTRTVRRIFKYDGKSYGIDMFRTFWYPHEGKWKNMPR
ncbi:conserved exported hypothetical protein [Paraburkholderia tropica]|uniref:hypothetical protein n=1 Tax=Paraburkholderia tropica TaxID=92647 RepID=UPI001CB65AF4|nr:multidrug ABC transporter ATPase [Paraburkholderia tropica]CAG9234926.1 conserved exported hypothetical protein [Paraburkholderia tropica]